LKTRTKHNQNRYTLFENKKMKRFQFIIIIILISFNVGKGQLTFGDVYDFEIGDLFQYSQVFKDEQATHIPLKYELEIIGKELNEEDGFVRYEINKTTVQEQNGWIVKNVIVYEYFKTDNFIIDSIIAFALDGFLDDDIFYESKEKWNFDSTYKRRAFIDTTKEFRLPMCQINSESVHIKAFVNRPDTYEFKAFYGKGLGLCNKVRYGVGATKGTETTTLHYFKKGDWECGDQILNVSRPKKTAQNDIYPNPFDKVIIVGSNDFESIKIFDLNGRLFYETINETIIQTDFLVQGIYIVEIKTKHETTRRLLTKK
jgi:hypothetical protein